MTLASATAVEAFLTASRGAYSRWSDVGISVRRRTKAAAAVRWEAEVLGYVELLCGLGPGELEEMLGYGSGGTSK